MTKKRRLHLLAPIVIALIVGTGLITWAESMKQAHANELAADVMLELGLGVFIAGVLASTVEFYFHSQKKAEEAEYLDQVQKKVFFALFGTALPDRMVHMMYDILFAQRFLRKGLTITIKLRELTDAEASRDPKDAAHLLVLNQKVTYEAHNISRGDATHKVCPQEFMLVPHMNFPQPFRGFKATPYGGAEVVTDVQSRSKLDADKMRYHLKTEEVKVSEGDKVSVVSEIELVCRDTDMRTWLTYYPADDLKLRVELHPDLLDELEFAVDQSHHDPLAEDREKGDGPLKFGWKISRPVLPYQGVVLFWRRKDPQPPAKLQPVTSATHAAGG